MNERELLDEKAIDRTIKRMAHEIIERNKTIENLVLVGIKTRGEFLANRLGKKISEIEDNEVIIEALDITLYRDDLSYLSQTGDPQVVKPMFKHNLEGKTVVIVDDVLYTGRTVRAALDAILETGRPSYIQLAILVDRGHRELPIRADFVGKNVPTSKNEQIKVRLSEVDNKDQVVIVNMAN
ncbi:bifunctional pyr operon transcriptional regulator/uracil phosphoribosyltransferase PyrR [Fundicoccus culcitae]|uniref:Bifunctional protein PyrR n=1 Tax=Fundicoccus culcitae TaxID=2969821 RepID=A0ABY5P708_9LACT|nr:bifunctional pyr operon transcriptional regulator/uracil phosphoribosyltransferase PyrR [Fundicoccus culcitae]UUX34218.1 bifunctional pyr operon transcriptional regulator/uracil phosphoribosyltransferase PyrR [Fundicoccus culcitae]